MTEENTPTIPTFDGPLRDAVAAGYFVLVSSVSGALLAKLLAAPATDPPSLVAVRSRPPGLYLARPWLWRLLQFAPWTHSSIPRIQALVAKHGEAHAGRFVELYALGGVSALKAGVAAAEESP